VDMMDLMDIGKCPAGPFRP